MNSKTKLTLLSIGTGVYAIGYGLLAAAALLGELRGLTGVAAIVMATGILIVLVSAVLLAKVEAELVGER